MTEPTVQISKTRRAWAVLLSLIPGAGAGHVLLGRWKRGLAWLGALWVLGATLALTGVVGAVLALLVTVAGVVDAARIRPPERGVPRRWVAVLGVLAFWLLMGGAQRVLRAYVAEPFHVPAADMEPTLLRGEHFMLDHTRGSPWGRRAVERGDLVVFLAPPDPDKHFLKRVVGQGGDVVALRGGQLVLNGRPVERSVVAACDTAELSEPQGPGCELHEEVLGVRRYRVTHRPDLGALLDFPDARGCPEGLEARDGGCVVPEEALFVLGDHRSNSYDSRHWGVVPVGSVVGVPTSIHFSWGAGGVRWERLGQRVE